MTDLLALQSDEQRFLIKCVGVQFDHHQQWPIFDYVEAECDKVGIDARQVVASLANSPLAGVAGFHYGPVWYNSHFPAADSPLILTVLGLYHYGGSVAIEIGEEFVHVLNLLIERRLSAPYNPFKLTTVTVTDADIAAKFPMMAPVMTHALPELLVHEPTTWQGTRSTGNGGWGIDLYRGILKYQGVGTLKEYLDRVNKLLERPEEVSQVEPSVPSPLDLVASLDYFNTVWQLHFDRKQPIIRIFRAERIARLAFGAATVDEFSSQTSCLTDIFKNMQVSGEGKTSLMRLQSFLKSSLPVSSHARVDSAVTMLRQIGDIRNTLFEHSGTEHVGAAALASLGLDFPVVDWPTAWSTVQRRAIEALEALREEIEQFHEIDH
jgi:hypothetical protein